MVAYFGRVVSTLDMRIHVYALFDPLSPEKIRYVGQTANLDNRFAVHLRARDRVTKAWVKSVRAQGRCVSVRILETTDEMNSKSCEAKWIQANDNGELLNLDKGQIVKEFLTTPIVSLRDLEHKYIRWVMGYCDGNKKVAAKLLGVGRQTLYNKLKQAES